ncbi:hypothetical protein M5D96_011750, partial [Drosophila gunungcola]
GPELILCALNSSQQTTKRRFSSPSYEIPLPLHLSCPTKVTAHALRFSPILSSPGFICKTFNFIPSGASSHVFSS